MREAIVGKLVGARVNRIEDRRLLTGTGRYIDDVVVPGMAHAAFLRSPFAHAHIRSIDTAAAMALPGVVGVLTGIDIQQMTNPVLGMMSLKGLYDPWHWALAVDRVRMVGDPVALVVAESRAVAEDACELIEVDYDPIGPIGTMAQALDPTRPVIWPGAGDNVIYRASETDGDIDAAFARADRVVRETFQIHRHSNQPMETRGVIVEVDPATRHLTVHSSHQAAHVLKYSLAMMLNRQPIWRSLQAMARQKDQTRAIGAGIRSFLRANPSLLKDTRPMLPVMVRQGIKDPTRVAHLGRSVLGLMSTPRADIPTVVTGDIGGAFGAKTTVLREDIAIVEGQIRGGVAQGIGAVLYEKTVYSDEAALQSGTFMDYLIPTAMEIPDIEIYHVETPSDIPFNYRGVGEGGMIGAPAAVTSAIEDALAHLGVRITEQHLPPTRILELAGVIPAPGWPPAAEKGARA